MKDNSFQLIANRLLKYRRRIISWDKIKEVIKEVLQDDYSDAKMYKIFYYLKNRGYLIDLKKWNYCIKKPEEEIIEEEIIDRMYWPTLTKWMKKLGKEKWYIGGLKALEIELWIYSSIDEILIVNSTRQGLESLIFEKKVFFKTYKKQQKNLFPFFYKYTRIDTIWWEKFRVALPELAILETLYRTSILQKNYWEELIKKWLKKHKKNFNLEYIEAFLRENKFNSSINSLATLAKSIDIDLYNNLNKIIKKSGYLLN